MKAALWLGAGMFLLVACPLGADEKKETKFDATKLVGTWKYASGEKNGEKVAADQLKAQTVIFTKETITLKGEMTFVMKYVLDATKTPVTVKLTMTESPFGAGATAEGIIELNGDDLRFCYSANGEAAPKKFETKQGANQHLFILKRSK